MKIKRRGGGREPDAYLSEQRHVLHDKCDVEERGETVEEVKLQEEETTE